MQRASLDFWENYLETMLFFKHTVLLNNVWSASSAKSRNENTHWEHKPYLNARLRKELIRPISSTVRNPLQAGNA